MGAQTLLEVEEQRPETTGCENVSKQAGWPLSRRNYLIVTLCILALQLSLSSLALWYGDEVLAFIAGIIDWIKERPKLSSCADTGTDISEYATIGMTYMVVLPFVLFYQYMTGNPRVVFRIPAESGDMTAKQCMLRVNAVPDVGADIPDLEAAIRGEKRALVEEVQCSEATACDRLVRKEAETKRKPPPKLSRGCFFVIPLLLFRGVDVPGPPGRVLCRKGLCVCCMFL